MGALSPRTRNAQVALYQSGDVDYLVATDAIGMGLNMNVDHVAFAATRKFDGFQYRHLNAGELGQVAGRAGRYMNDGTFGVTGEADPFEPEMVERLALQVDTAEKRLNRERAAPYLRGQVLNTFAYTGAFGVYAACLNQAQVVNLAQSLGLVQRPFDRAGHADIPKLAFRCPGAIEPPVVRRLSLQQSPVKIHRCSSSREQSNPRAYF